MYALTTHHVFLWWWCFFAHFQGKWEKAKPLYERSLAICEKVLGRYHLDVTDTQYRLAGLFERQVRAVNRSKNFRVGHDLQASRARYWLDLGALLPPTW